MKKIIFINKNRILKYREILILILAFILLVLHEYIKSIEHYRVLVYTCCDEFYSHYIPIFCNGLLRMDKLKKIDIEIGVNIKKLSDNEEKALQYLRKKYPQSKIQIDYNSFVKNKSGVYYNNQLFKIGSIRFVIQPRIKNKYVYISDVDILVLVNNFYLELIDDMKRRKKCYSNIQRINTLRLTGLHFIKYDSYYPIPVLNNTSILDEILLYNIMKAKGIKIDNYTQYRPVFGIHLSPSRPNVGSYAKTVGWGADNYKFQWLDYMKSEDFKFIYPLLDSTIINKIKKLNKFFAIDQINI